MSKSERSVFLSIIIPAYNEEFRLPPSLEKIVAFLQQQGYTSEVIVVENGSTDRTSQVVAEFAAAMPDSGPVCPNRQVLSISSGGLRARSAG